MFESFLKPTITTRTITGDVCTFTSPGVLPLKSHTVDIDSVSGVSVIHVQNTCGINQWDEVWENGLINSTTGENEPNSAYIRSKNFIRINPNTNYYYKTSAVLRLVYYDANKEFVGIANANNTIVLSPANAYYVRFFPNTSSYGTTYKNDISINYPSTDTSYHAFEGQSFNISIGQTVNEGEYDARTGILEATSPTVQTIQLAPCPIDVLEGQNNIWADTGETTLSYITIG